MGFLLWKFMNKLQRKKAKLHKKMRVKDETPGALITKANTQKSIKGLPTANTELGVAWRGLV